ncbi:MAG: hypothetical protein K6F33_10560 [Bacteroidales bacterium]|nr:hypothetical protein [Bacteroidales bacterium]
MKKITLCLVAILATALVSCLGDDSSKNKEEEEQRNDKEFIYIEASRTTTKGSLENNTNWGIHGNVLAVYTADSESADVTGIVGKMSDILVPTDGGRTTIYGIENDEFISITFNGTLATLPTDYKITQKIEDDNVSALLVEYLSTGTLTDEMTNKFDFNALIIYKNAKDANASSSNFWYSYDCTINPSEFSVYNVKYIQGTFTARMRNKDGDTFMFMPGAFSCLGF